MNFQRILFPARNKFTFLAAFSIFLLAIPSLSRAAGLDHEAYVWQRTWNDSVVEAVTNHGPVFSHLVILKAEVVWHGQEPEVIPARVDCAALRATHRPIGIALRIGGYAGPFSAKDRTAGFLCQLATSLITEARTNGIIPEEFQIDFDCAASKLNGYRIWAETIRKNISPLPLTITALPSWLSEPSFKPLAEATDGYVLLVAPQPGRTTPQLDQSGLETLLGVQNGDHVRNIVSAVRRLGVNLSAKEIFAANPDMTPEDDITGREILIPLPKSADGGPAQPNVGEEKPAEELQPNPTAPKDPAPQI